MHKIKDGKCGKFTSKIMECYEWVVREFSWAIEEKFSYADVVSKKE